MDNIMEQNERQNKKKSPMQCILEKIAYKWAFFPPQIVDFSFKFSLLFLLVILVFSILPINDNKNLTISYNKTFISTLDFSQKFEKQLKLLYLA